MIDFIDLYKCAEGSMCCVADNCMSYIEINSSLTFKKKIYSLIKILIVTKRDCQRDYYMWHEMANVVWMQVQSFLAIQKKRQEKKQKQQQQQKRQQQN